MTPSPESMGSEREVHGGRMQVEIEVEEDRDDETVTYVVEVEVDEHGVGTTGHIIGEIAWKDGRPRRVDGPRLYEHIELSREQRRSLDELGMTVRPLSRRRRTWSRHV